MIRGLEALLLTIRAGPAYKLTRPYKGPYHVIGTHPNGVELRSVDNLKNSTIHVALNRVRHCPDTLTNNVDVAEAQRFLREMPRNLRMLEIAPVKYVMVEWLIRNKVKLTISQKLCGQTD